MYVVILTTSANEAPFASRIARRFWNTRSLCVWMSPAPTLTMQGRLNQVHAFFCSRIPAQMLAIAAPLSSPWLPRGLRTGIEESRFRASACGLALGAPQRRRSERAGRRRGSAADGTGWVRPSPRGLVVVTSRQGAQATWGRQASVHRLDRLSDLGAARVLLDL